MKMKDFKEIVIKTFSPVLIDYSMKFVSIKKICSGHFVCIYENKTTAVEIILEGRDCCLSVYIHKLFNGEITPLPDSKREFLNSELSGFDLNYIIRYYDEKSTIKSLYEYSYNFNVENKSDIFYDYFSSYATALKTYCNDILNGDFTKFKTYEIFVKKIVSKY